MAMVEVNAPVVAVKPSVVVVVVAIAAVEVVAVVVSVSSMVVVTVPVLLLFDIHRHVLHNWYLHFLHDLHMLHNGYFYVLHNGVGHFNLLEDWVGLGHVYMLHYGYVYGVGHVDFLMENDWRPPVSSSTLLASTSSLH